MDARIQTVTDALREAGATAPMLDTDALAKVVLDAIDREHGTSADNVPAPEPANPTIPVEPPPAAPAVAESTPEPEAAPE